MSCGQGVRSDDDGGACCVRWRKLLPGRIVGADGVSCGELLRCELGEPERVLLGQLLPRGICELDGVRGWVLLLGPDGGGCVPLGVVVPCGERERERVPGRVLLPDAGIERRGVHGVELLPWGIDGDDELHRGVVLPSGRDGEPCAMQRGILLPWWSEQPRGVPCGDVLPDGGHV